MGRTVFKMSHMLSKAIWLLSAGLNFCEMEIVMLSYSSQSITLSLGWTSFTVVWLPWIIAGGYTYAVSGTLAFVCCC